VVFRGFVSRVICFRPSIPFHSASQLPTQIQFIAVLISRRKANDAQAINRYPVCASRADGAARDGSQVGKFSMDWKEQKSISLHSLWTKCCEQISPRIKPHLWILSGILSSICFISYHSFGVWTVSFVRDLMDGRLQQRVAFHILMLLCGFVFVLFLTKQCFFPSS